jgi:glucoamylase
VHLASRPSSVRGRQRGLRRRIDGLTDLADGRLDHQYESTGDQGGNIMLTGPAAARSRRAGDPERTSSSASAPRAGWRRQQHRTPSDTGLDEVLARFNGEGDRVGWEDWIGLPDRPAAHRRTVRGWRQAGLCLGPDAEGAGGPHPRRRPDRLPVQPVGRHRRRDQASTGYKAVWPRDFYQVAMALLALGDAQTPVAAFRYLPQVQVRADTPGNTGATGWFLQKTHVDGTGRMGRGPAGPDRHADHAGLEAVEGRPRLGRRAGPPCTAV